MSAWLMHVLLCSEGGGGLMKYGYGQQQFGGAAASAGHDDLHSKYEPVLSALHTQYSILGQHL